MFDYQDYRNRYSQHVLFYEAGVDNRQQVYDAKVAIIGLGSIGIEAARLLAIAQVQLLRFIYWEETGHDPQEERSLTDAAACLSSGLTAVHELATANSSLAIEIVDGTGMHLPDLLQDIDLVLYADCSSERCRLLSESCRELHKSWIYAEAQGGAGMTANIIPGKTPCIGCIKTAVQFSDGGFRYAPTVTDLIARTMAQFQAIEALKILGASPSVSTEVFCFDVDQFSYTRHVARNEACSCCAP